MVEALNNLLTLAGRKLDEGEDYECVCMLSVRLVRGALHFQVHIHTYLFCTGSCRVDVNCVLLRYGLIAFVGKSLMCFRSYGDLHAVDGKAIYVAHGGYLSR